MNRLADALSRLPADILTSKIHAYKVSEHLKDEEFILAVNEPIEDSNTDELTTDSENEANIWIAYRIQYDTAENTAGKSTRFESQCKNFLFPLLWLIKK